MITAPLRAQFLYVRRAELLAEWLLKNWKFEQSDAPDRWFTSGDTTKLVENGRRAFGVTIINPEHITI